MSSSSSDLKGVFSSADVSQWAPDACSRILRFLANHAFYSAVVGNLVLEQCSEPQVRLVITKCQEYLLTQDEATRAVGDFDLSWALVPRKNPVASLSSPQQGAPASPAGSAPTNQGTPLTPPGGQKAADDDGVEGVKNNFPPPLRQQSSEPAKNSEEAVVAEAERQVDAGYVDNFLASIGSDKPGLPDPLAKLMANRLAELGVSNFDALRRRPLSNVSAALLKSVGEALPKPSTMGLVPQEKRHREAELFRRSQELTMLLYLLEAAHLIGQNEVFGEQSSVMASAYMNAAVEWLVSEIVKTNGDRVLQFVDKSAKPMFEAKLNGDETHLTSSATWASIIATNQQMKSYLASLTDEPKSSQPASASASAPAQANKKNNNNNNGKKNQQRNNANNNNNKPKTTASPAKSSPAKDKQ